MFCFLEQVHAGILLDNMSAFECVASTIVLHNNPAHPWHTVLAMHAASDHIPEPTCAAISSVANASYRL
jgi:hypothetical protein